MWEPILPFTTSSISCRAYAVRKYYLFFKWEFNQNILQCPFLLFLPDIISISAIWIWWLKSGNRMQQKISTLMLLSGILIKQITQILVWEFIYWLQISRNDMIFLSFFMTVFKVCWSFLLLPSAIIILSSP